MPAALFIGGIADGRWINVPDGAPTYQVQALPKISLVADPTVTRYQQMSAPMRRETYKEDSLSWRSDRWRVFVPINWEGRDWITALLRGYRQPLSES